jgi:hypothetical protein
MLNISIIQCFFIIAIKGVTRMTEFRNATIVQPKKGVRSKNGYCALRLQIGSELAKRMKLGENSRLSLAYDNDDKAIWHLFVSDDGFKVSKSKNECSYNIAMSYPFNFYKKSMIEVPRKEIDIDTDKRMMTVFVHEIFNKDKGEVL